jgi:hypothetical protein
MLLTRELPRKEASISGRFVWSRHFEKRSRPAAQKLARTCRRFPHALDCMKELVKTDSASLQHVSRAIGHDSAFNDDQRAIGQRTNPQPGEFRITQDSWL